MVWSTKLCPGRRPYLKVGLVLEVGVLGSQGPAGKHILFPGGLRGNGMLKRDRTGVGTGVSTVLHCSPQLDSLDVSAEGCLLPWHEQERQSIWKGMAAKIRH